MQINIPDIMRYRQQMNADNNRAQVQAAQAAAAGQARSARESATGNVLGTIWGAPADFGNIFGGMYGQYAGNAGQQGQNYVGAQGAYTAGLGGLGNNAQGNYEAYAQALSNLGGTASQNLGNYLGSMATAEAARQGTVGNLGSAAIGAWGSAANAAMQAQGLGQQAYFGALAQAMNSNQNALSALGQSRYGALANLGGAYAPIASAASQLGAAGLGASRFDASDSMTEEVANARQRTGATGRTTGSSSASAVAGTGGESGGSGFQATGPGGTIASGSYSGDGAGGLAMEGRRSSTGSSEQSNFGESDQYGRRSNLVSTRSGPQMDAFGAALGTGAAGIGQALQGLTDARGAVMDNAYLDAARQGNNQNISALQGAYRSSSGAPRQMMGDTLAGLVELGRQGYGASTRGMNQFYGNAGNAYGSDPSRSALGLLTAGYVDAGNRLGSLQGGMGAAYGDTVGNIGGVRSDLRSGLNTARGDVQGLYDGSVGNWMQGNYSPNDIRAPRYREPTREERQRDIYNQGYDWDAGSGVWRSPGGGVRNFPGPTTSVAPQAPTMAYTDWRTDGQARLNSLMNAYRTR